MYMLMYGEEQILLHKTPLCAHISLSAHYSGLVCSFEHILLSRGTEIRKESLYVRVLNKKKKTLLIQIIRIKNVKH